MKKLIIGTFMLFGFATVYAQKNTVLIGGDASFSRKKVDGSKIDRNISFSPYIGYQFADNWTIGAKTKIGNGVDNSYGGNKTTTNEYEAGGFIRYTHYFNDTFAVYGDLGGGYLQSSTNVKNKEKNEVIAERERAYGFYTDFTPALFVNFKNGFGLNVSFGNIRYSRTEANVAYDKDNKVKDSKFKVTLGNSISVGVSKNFSF